MTELPKRAFIAHRSLSHDYSKLEALDIVEQIPIAMNYLDFSNPAKTLAHIRRFVAGSTPNDILVVGGHPVLNMLAMKVWFEFHNVCNLAVFAVDADSYRVISVPRE